jgi:hypothetical protein
MGPKTRVVVGTIAGIATYIVIALVAMGISNPLNPSSGVLTALLILTAMVACPVVAIFVERKGLEAQQRNEMAQSAQLEAMVQAEVARRARAE